MAEREVIVPIPQPPDGRVTRPAIAIAMTVSKPELEHFAMLRARSYELSITRGHVRRA